MASRYAAAQTRLRKFEEAGPPPEPPRKQDIRMRLRGGRTGTRAVTCKRLELTGLMSPFDLEVFYGERVAVLGSNGSGKSHFLRLLAGQHVAHSGTWKLGARVVPGFFAQTHAHPELEGRTLTGILWDALREGPRRRDERAAPIRARPPGRPGVRQTVRRPAGALPDPAARAAGIDRAAARRADRQPGPRIAEALQSGLEAYEGTVLAVTHDRWFARTFDRYLVFGTDGMVRETSEPVWDERRVNRAR